MNASPDATVEDSVKEYTDLRPTYERFTEKLLTLLQELLTDSAIDYESLTGRTKAVSRFAEKLRRPGKNYSKPLSQVTDLTGIRIVAFYLEDADRIGELINNEFQVDANNSVKTGQMMAPNEFGYRSSHYVVKLPPPRRRLREWSAFKDLKAEVQVRTVLQHAWASVSRTFDYSREMDIPQPLRRRLFRLAGLFELVDDEFSEIRSAHDAEAKAIAQKLRRGDTQVELSSDSLRAYFAKSAFFNGLVDVARAVGFVVTEKGSDDEFVAGGDSFIPAIVGYARRLSIKTLSEFANTVEIPIATAKRYLRALKSESSRTWGVTVPFLATLLLIRSRPDVLGAGVLMESGGWHQPIARRVVRVARADKKLD